MQKGIITREAYISSTRELINLVFNNRDAISSREQVMHVFGSLDLQYPSLVINITNKKHVPNLEDIF